MSPYLIKISLIHNFSKEVFRIRKTYTLELSVAACGSEYKQIQQKGNTGKTGWQS